MKVSSAITKNTTLIQNLLLICSKKQICLNHKEKIYFKTSETEKIGLSVYGGNIRKDINEEYRCVTENWMKENFDDRVKEWFPLKHGNFIVKLEDDEDVDDYDKTKSVNTMPSHFLSYIFSHSKSLMKDVIKQIGGLYNNNNNYYTDTDSLYIHKKYWSILVDNGYVGKSLGLGKIDYSDSGLF